jgi:frataxin-like iron-binding protein CyaY
MASFKKTVLVDECGYCGFDPDRCFDKCSQTLRDEWYMQSRILSCYDYRKDADKSLENNPDDIAQVRSGTNCDWNTAAKVLEFLTVPDAIMVINNYTPICGNWTSHLVSIQDMKTCHKCVCMTGNQPISIQSISQRLKTKSQ